MFTRSYLLCLHEKVRHYVVQVRHKVVQVRHYVVQLTDIKSVNIKLHKVTKREAGT